MRNHHRERLVFPVLPGSESRYRGLAVRSARQVKAAEPFDRYDGPRSERMSRRFNRIAGAIQCGEPAGLIGQAYSGPADGAGIRLGMKAAVGS